MSEYIITDKQLKTAAEAYVERELVLPITEVFVSGERLPEIVRCRDCIRYSLDNYGNTWCAYVASAVQPDDFCAWGERKC